VGSTPFDKMRSMASKPTDPHCVGGSGEAEVAVLRRDGSVTDMVKSKFTHPRSTVIRAGTRSDGIAVISMRSFSWP
jgi:hypothetical protein